MKRSAQLGYPEGPADLFTFGKVMGGGSPAAAFGGRADVMEHLAPTGPVYQAGTLSGNPVATAAGLTTLKLTTELDVYSHIARAADILRPAVASALETEGVEHTIQSANSMFSVFFTDREVINYDDARTQNVDRYSAFFNAMLDQGIHMPPSAFEAWFLSYAHTDENPGPDHHGPARRSQGRGERTEHAGELMTTIHLVRHGEVDIP